MSKTTRTLEDALREIENLRRRIAALEAAGRGDPRGGFARLALARLPADIPGREPIGDSTEDFYLHTNTVRLVDLTIDGTWTDGSERVRMRNDGEEEVTVVNPWAGTAEAGSEVALGELPNGLLMVLAEECKDDA